MPKTAKDPFAATVMTPDVIAGRHAIVVTPDAVNDLANVTRSLIVTTTAAGTITVIMADDSDQQAVQIPIAIGSWQLYLQIRRVTAASLTGGCGLAIWR